MNDKEEKTNKTSEGIESCVEASLEGILGAFDSILNIKLEKDQYFEIHAGNEFKSAYTTIASVPFAGSITGEFFLCLNRSNWIEPIKNISGLEEGPELDELINSSLKEIANTTLGSVIPEIKNYFGVINMLAPRLIEGKLIYPKTQIFSYTLSDPSGRFCVEAHLSFDLMEQDIGAVYRKLSKESKLDDTGLFNKKYFQTTLDQIKVDKTNRFYSVVFLDVNRLKYVNDNFGHEAGDQYIQEAFDCVKHSCLPSDRVFRIGGDEAVAILFDCDVDGAQRVAERIKIRLKQKIIAFNSPSREVVKINVESSIGVASTSEKENIDIAEVVRIADERMEQSKKSWYEEQNLKRRGVE